MDAQPTLREKQASGELSYTLRRKIRRHFDDSCPQSLDFL
jgi:hypothetical protein